MLEDLHKRGKTPQALKDRPIITDKILPYYRGWNLLDARRQHNETGSQPLPLSDLRSAAEICMSDDPDEIYEFCMVMTTVEAWVLKEMAAERKRAIEREKRKAKHG
ncbi:hypothetical protein vBVpaS1601_25 [Vibrio phage vB_VpaS_1601]|nr:hypothetical protein vBVpaP1601_25 [Vibrio phage vB_VpaP_1601]